ncbi:MAG: RNA polymerase sigma factor [Spirochaetales bacterium]|nr:RNA polymerase sigma factor [Spirochaetales bacterium]
MHDEPRERPIITAEDDGKDLLAVQKTLQGETGAFSDIVNRYTPVMYSLAARLLENREEAEDAVQEIFLAVFRSLKSFNIEARFYSWLYTIAVNKIRSLLRKKHRFTRTVSLDTEDAPDLPDARENLQLQVVSSAEEERARAAISRLKPIYRIVFVLRFIEGMSLNDMAEILDLPAGTVKARLHRARKQLISILTEK